MIKPFTITAIREEQDGTKTVFYTVSKSTIISKGITNTQTMDATINIPASVTDVDLYIFNLLQESGWL